MQNGPWAIANGAAEGAAKVSHAAMSLTRSFSDQFPIPRQASGVASRTTQGDRSVDRPRVRPWSHSDFEADGANGPGAGSGNRTRILSLEGCCTTIVLYPRLVETRWWGKQDSNLRRLTPADLQSAPFATRDIPPLIGAQSREGLSDLGEGLCHGSTTEGCYSDHARRNARPRRLTRRRDAEAEGLEWVWGAHAVRAALANPARVAPERLLLTPERARDFASALAGFSPVVLASAEIARELPDGAVHQGAAVLVRPSPATPLETLASPAEGVLVMLDQLTDPQNVGAIFRSAAAFGGRGLILQERHAPALGGALAKAAAGAVDHIPHARVVNLARALEALADRGWRAIGLAAEAPETLSETLDGAPVVLVLGAEGEGLRRLVREHCDALARIPMTGGLDSLNVASAAAVALYEAARQSRVA